MYKFLMTLFVISSIVLFSCSKDDNETVSIVGKWNYNKVVTGYTEIPPGTSTKDTTVFDAGSFVEFKSDGTFNYFSSIGGSTDEGDGTYAVNGSTITVTEDSEVSTADIIELTKSSLQLYFKETSATYISEEWSYFTR